MPTVPLPSASPSPPLKTDVSTSRHKLVDVRVAPAVGVVSRPVIANVAPIAAPGHIPANERPEITTPPPNLSQTVGSRHKSSNAATQPVQVHESVHDPIPPPPIQYGTRPPVLRSGAIESAPAMRGFPPDIDRAHSEVILLTPDYLESSPQPTHALDVVFPPIQPGPPLRVSSQQGDTRVSPPPVRPKDNVVSELPPGFVPLPTVAPNSEPTRAHSDHVDFPVSLQSTSPPPVNISSDVSQDTQLVTSLPVAEGVRITPLPFRGKDMSGAPKPPMSASQPPAPVDVAAHTPPVNSIPEEVRRSPPRTDHDRPPLISFDAYSAPFAPQDNPQREDISVPVTDHPGRAPFRDERKQTSNPHPAPLSTFSDERPSNLHASHGGPVPQYVASTESSQMQRSVHNRDPPPRTTAIQPSVAPFDSELLSAQSEVIFFAPGRKDPSHTSHAKPATGGPDDNRVQLPSSKTIPPQAQIPSASTSRESEVILVPRTFNPSPPPRPSAPSPPPRPTNPPPMSREPQPNPGVEARQFSRPLPNIPSRAVDKESPSFHIDLSPPATPPAPSPPPSDRRRASRSLTIKSNEVTIPPRSGIPPPPSPPLPPSEREDWSFSIDSHIQGGDNHTIQTANVPQMNLSPVSISPPPVKERRSEKQSMPSRPPQNLPVPAPIERSISLNAYHSKGHDQSADKPPAPRVSRDLRKEILIPRRPSSHHDDPNLQYTDLASGISRQKIPQRRVSNPLSTLDESRSRSPESEDDVFSSPDSVRSRESAPWHAPPGSPPQTHRHTASLGTNKYVQDPLYGGRTYTRTPDSFQSDYSSPSNSPAQPNRALQVSPLIPVKQMYSVQTDTESLMSTQSLTSSLEVATPDSATSVDSFTFRDTDTSWVHEKAPPVPPPPPMDHPIRGSAQDQLDPSTLPDPSPPFGASSQTAIHLDRVYVPSAHDEYGSDSASEDDATSQGSDMYVNIPESTTPIPDELAHEENITPIANPEPTSDPAFHERTGESRNLDDALNPGLISTLAVKVKSTVPRAPHTKGEKTYDLPSFTGKDMVNTIQLYLEEIGVTGTPMNDRSLSLQVARILQVQGERYYHNVTFDKVPLTDSDEEIYIFVETKTDSYIPFSVIPLVTECYSYNCRRAMDNNPCYSRTCPKRVANIAPSIGDLSTKEKNGHSIVEDEVAKTPSASELKRRGIIRGVIRKEEQYFGNLNTLESLFIIPLRTVNPPVMMADELEAFIGKVFGNILELRDCSRSLLEELHEELDGDNPEPGARSIADILLAFSAQFQTLYTAYIGHYALSGARLDDYYAENSDLERFFLQCAQSFDAHNLHIKDFLAAPYEHLQNYPPSLEAILTETVKDQPEADVGILKDAIRALKGVAGRVKLRSYQISGGVQPNNIKGWHDLGSGELSIDLSEKEVKRQNIIFEFIHSEMEYVADLKFIQTEFMAPLFEVDPPLVHDKSPTEFVKDVFGNISALHNYHSNQLDLLQQIQYKQWPAIRSITATVHDTILNAQQSYMACISDYPVAVYFVDHETATNRSFRKFIADCTRLPGARKHDMKNFVNRPLSRLPRYQLLLENILKVTPKEHEDQELIPQALTAIKSLLQSAQQRVPVAESRVRAWQYGHQIDPKLGEVAFMELHKRERYLFHHGKLLRESDTTFEKSSSTELYVFLFDHLLIMTKPEEKDGKTRYNVHKRPIPLELLKPVNFTDVPQPRSGSFRSRFVGRGDQTANAKDSSDVSALYPCVLDRPGKDGGPIKLFAESQASRTQWREKIEEAIRERGKVQVLNRVFELNPLDTSTFRATTIPSRVSRGQLLGRGNMSDAGRITCSVSFTASGGRSMIAVGTDEGVYVGSSEDNDMRRVIDLKMVTQCTVLENFEIFLVLANKSLWAYHIDYVTPDGTRSAASSSTFAPQKVSSKGVSFFNVGKSKYSNEERTMVIYMTKSSDSKCTFTVVQPVRFNQNAKESSKGAQKLASRLGLGGSNSQSIELFKVLKELPFAPMALDLIFVKTKPVILSAKGFDIMNSIDSQRATIPISTTLKQDSQAEKLARRLSGSACKPIGLFHASDDEFLLCYNEFGLYVDQRGVPSRSTQTVEWEGKAERVALHPPYIVLFDPKFVEIRHLETGRLVQIILGDDVRCTWDSRGVAVILPTSPGADGWSEIVAPEPRIHVVTNNVEHANSPYNTGKAQRSATQVVYELVPVLSIQPESSISPRSPTSSFTQLDSESPTNVAVSPMTS